MYAKEPLSQTAKDLLAIADKIDELGWCQNKCVASDGKVCILGAALSLGFNTYRPQDRNYTHPAILAIQEYVDIAFWNWNDEPGRTQQEVTTMLRELAFNLNEK
jgi:hypothetical protein